MPEKSFKTVIQSIWAKYRSLKTWQQIVIAVVLLALIFGSSGSSDSENSAKSAPLATETSEPAANAIPFAEPSEVPSVEPTPSATPESPIDFRFGALRDLGDIRKDVKEARLGITADGLGRYYWNTAEIGFNMAQLESMVPRDEYAEKWNTALAKLRIAVDALNPDDDSLTVSKAKSALDSVLSKVSPLEAIARTIAN